MITWRKRLSLFICVLLCLSVYTVPGTAAQAAGVPYNVSSSGAYVSVDSGTLEGLVITDNYGHTTTFLNKKVTYSDPRYAHIFDEPLPPTGTHLSELDVQENAIREAAAPYTSQSFYVIAALTYTVTNTTDGALTVYYTASSSGSYSRVEFTIQPGVTANFSTAFSKPEYVKVDFDSPDESSFNAACSVYSDELDLCYYEFEFTGTLMPGGASISLVEKGAKVSGINQLDVSIESNDITNVAQIGWRSEGNVLGGESSFFDGITAQPCDPQKLNSLAVVRGIHFEDGVASWNAVENATAYFVEVYNSANKALNNKIITSETKLNLAPWIINNGHDHYYFRITALGDCLNYYHSGTQKSPVFTYDETCNLTYSYLITVEQPEHGSISPESGMVEMKSSQTFVITADEGYEVTAVYDGYRRNISPATSYSYKLYNVSGSRTIGAIIQPLSRFIDATEDDWYYSEVKYLWQNGIMNGISENVFSPNTPVSRAMILTALYRMEGNPKVTGSQTFSDVAGGQWYSNAIIWAAENGITSGYPDGMFRPNDAITREELITFIGRYYRNFSWGSYYLINDLDHYEMYFTDLEKISDFAYYHLEWAIDGGLIRGKGEYIYDNHGYLDKSTTLLLDPQGTATRAEAAVILYRYILPTG